MLTSVKIALLAWILSLITVFAHAMAQAPQRTTSTYDDWTVSCVTGSAPAGHKSCVMVQIQTIHGQPNPVGQITISRPIKRGPFKIFFQIPSNVWLQTGLLLIASDKQPGLGATFKWCTATRCLADADLKDAAIKQLRAMNEPARVAFKDAAQHDVLLPVSLKGFGPALDWMEKQ